MNYAMAAVGIRDLSDVETQSVSGGFVAELAYDLAKTMVKETIIWAYKEGVGWVTTKVNDANQTGVAGQPGYVDAMGNASGVSVPNTNTDNVNDF